MPENLESSAAKRRREESESSTGDHSGEDSEAESEESVESKDATKFYSILSNERYSDVILVASGNVEVKSHRCLLGYSSKIFADIIESSAEIPVRIKVDGFEGEIVKGAVGFLCGNYVALKGKEKEIFKFAEKYEIDDLKKACQELILPPEKPRSAFYFWMSETRDSLKKPGMSIADVASAAGREWKKLTDKTNWEKMSEDDKGRFEEEMKIYQTYQ